MFIAKGSAGETRSQLYRIYDAGIIDEKTLKAKIEEVKHLSAKIGSLISHLKNSNKKGWRFEEPPGEYE